MNGIWKYILVGVAAFVLGSATIATASSHITKFVISNEDETRTVGVTQSKRLKTHTTGNLRITNLTDIQGPQGSSRLRIKGVSDRPYRTGP